MEFKDKGYHFPHVLDRHVLLANTLNFCPGPITVFLIYISYREIAKKEKSQSAEMGINALWVWYSSFIPLKQILAAYQFAVKKDFFSVVKLISIKMARLFPLADYLLFVKMNHKIKQNLKKGRKKVTWENGRNWS